MRVGRKLSDISSWCFNEAAGADPADALQAGGGMVRCKWLQ